MVGLFYVFEDYIKFGIMIWDVDYFVYEYIVVYDVIFGEFNFEGYKYLICVSVNDMICYGCFSKDILVKDGDLLKVDIVINYYGYFSDFCYVFVVGILLFEVKKFMEVIYKVLYFGID